jgi:hypothetical protein
MYFLRDSNLKSLTPKIWRTKSAYRLLTVVYLKIGDKNRYKRSEDLEPVYLIPPEQRIGVAKNEFQASGTIAVHNA